MAAEVRQMLENVRSRLRTVGLDMPDVVKATVYLTGMSEFATYNEVWREYFPSDPPTRATVGVAALAVGAQCEIEVVAAR
jgi:2-iminobutanoate/2-iminopropanoate deaminase